MQFKQLLCGFAALAGALVLHSPANATPLLAGATLFPPASEADPIGGSVVDSIVQAISTPSYTGTLTSQVVSGGTNPLGGLTFIYRLQNNAGTHSLSRLTLNGFLTAAGIVSADTSYNVSLGSIAPAYIDRSASGDTIGFSFAGSPVGAGTIAPGQSSYWLVVQTNSATYAPSFASVINGSVQSVPSFSPVPEPSTISLALLGLCGLLAARRPRKTSK